MDTYLAKYDEKYPLMCVEIDAKQLERECKDTCRTLGDKWNEAKGNFRQYNWEAFLDNLRKTEDGAKVVEAETRFAGQPSLETLLSKLDEEIPKKKLDYAEKMKQKDITEQLRVTRDLVNSAKGHFKHHRNEDCLCELIQAKRMVQELADNEDFFGDAKVEEFIALSTKDLDDLKTEYDERVLSRDASDKIGNIKSALNSTTGYIDHHNEEAAFKSLKTAMDARATLASSEDISHLKVVQEFLESSTTTMVELRTATNQKVAQREANAISRVVRDMLSMLKDHLSKSRWEMFVKGASELRSTLASASALPSEQFNNATVELAEYTKSYHEAVFEREVKDCIRAVSALLDTADGALNHHNPELFLTSLNKASNSQYELEAFGGQSTEAKIAHGTHVERITALNKRYESIEIKKQAMDALHTATSTWKITREAFSGHRHEQAQKNFRDTKRAVLQLACPAWIEAFAEVAEFVSSFDAEAKAFSEEYEATMIKREYTATARELTDMVGAAESHFSHSRAEMMLKSMHDAKGHLERIVKNEDFNIHSAELVASVTARTDELKIKHAEKVLKGQLDDAQTKATAAIREAKDALFHTNFPVVLEKLRDSKQAISDLINNPLFQGMPSVEEFFTTTGAEVNQVEADYGSKFDAIALSAAKRSCTDCFSGAENAFNQNNQEELLRFLFKAKDLINEVQDEEFVAEYRAKVTELAQKGEEKLFASELGRRKRKISNTLSAARDHLNHHRHQSALEAMKDVKGLLSALSSDERFLASETVNVALVEFAVENATLAVDVNVAIREHELKAHRREIVDLVGAMQRTYAHYLTDQFLKESVDTKASLSRFADNYDDQADFVDENREKMTELNGQFRDRELSGEISALLRTIQTHWSNAQSAFSHYNNQAALESVNEAKAGAESLNDPRFEGDATIEAFFSTWKQQLDTFSDNYNDRTQKKEIDDLRRLFTDTMTAASTALDRSIFDVSVSKSAEAEGILDNLKSLSKHDFADETLRIETLKNNINEKAFAKEINAAISNCESNLSVAKEQFLRFNPEGALEAFQSCKDQAADLRLNHDSVALVGTFLSEFDEKLKTFSREFAEKTLQTEARDAIRSAKDKLALTTLFLQRQCEDKALSNLREAKSEVATMTSSNSMIANLPSVIAFVEEYTTIEKQVVAQFVASEAAGQVRTLKSKVQELETVIKRGLDSAVAYDNTMDIARVLIDDDLSRHVDVVDVALTEFATVATTIGKDIWKVEAKLGDPALGVAGDGAVSIMSLLGGSISSAPITTIKKIKMGTEIDPDYYREYKIINDGVDGINQYMRDIQRNIKSVDLNKHDKPWKAVGDPAERIDSIMKRIQKDGINVIQKQKPEDETLLAFMQGYATVGQQFVSNCNTWRLAGKIIDAVAGGAWIKIAIAFSLKCLKGFEGKGPHNIDRGYNKELWDMRGPITLASLNESLYDSNVALTAVSKWIPAAKSKLAHWVEEFGGYPGQEQMETFLEEKRLQLLKAHAIHCTSAAILNGTFEQDKLKAYRKALDAFPLARKDVVTRMRGVYDEFWSTRTYEATPFDKWINVEDWEKEPVGTPFEEENESWYTEPKYLIPATQGAEIGKEKDEASSIQWSSHREKFKGKIVFSKETIERTAESDSAFCDEFEFGKDKVCGRAYWEHAISNYAIGEDDDGKLLFGPQKVHHHDTVYLQLLLFVSVDGKRMVREGTPGGCITFFEMRNQPDKRESASNYAGFSQSCRLHLLANGRTDDLYDQWVRDAHRIGHHAHQSGPGKKKVDVDLCFRWVSTHPNVARKIVFPYQTTPISEPIASGSFMLNIAKDVTKPTFFPLSKSSFSDESSKAAAIKEYLSNASDWGKRTDDTEQPLQVAVFGDFYIANYEWYEIVGHSKLVKKPASYGINCTALFYRSPARGWKCESLAAFELSAYATVAPDQQPKLPPVSGGIGVGSSAFFDVSLLSEAEMKDFERCPERMRRGHY